MSSPSASRREKEKSELRLRILDAAREIMVAEGPDALSMRRIADRIEYSATAIYLHFKDKDALIGALMTNDFLQLGHAFSEVDKIADPIERLRQAAWIYLRFGVSFPHHYRVMFMTPLSAEQLARSEADGCAHKGQPDQDAYALVQTCVRTAMDAGALKPQHTDVDLVAQVCWTALHGVVSMHIAKGENTTWCDWKGPDAIAEQMIDALINWLRK